MGHDGGAAGSGDILGKGPAGSRGLESSRVVYLSPQGSAADARTSDAVCGDAQAEGLVLLCGRYEGIDERLIERCVDEEISIGDFVLSGGEIPAMALLDAVVRQLPGVLNDADSAVQDSLLRACWIARITRDRRSTPVSGCRMCCCPVTTSDSSLAPETGAGADVATPARLAGWAVLSKEETQLLGSFRSNAVGITKQEF